MKKKSVLL